MVRQLLQQSRVECDRIQFNDRVFGDRELVSLSGRTWPTKEFYT